MGEGRGRFGAHTVSLLRGGQKHVRRVPRLLMYLIGAFLTRLVVRVFSLENKLVFFS